MSGQCLLLQLSHHQMFAHEWVNKEAVQLGSATQVEAIYHFSAWTFLWVNDVQSKPNMVLQSNNEPSLFNSSFPCYLSFSLYIASLFSTQELLGSWSESMLKVNVFHLFCQIRRKPREIVDWTEEVRLLFICMCVCVVWLLTEPFHCSNPLYILNLLDLIKNSPLLCTNSTDIFILWNSLDETFQLLCAI